MKIEPLAVSVRDAADAIGVGRSTCYALISSGRLRSINVSKRATRVPVEALREFVNRQTDAADGVAAPPGGGQRR
jgi:excisionase family DNA binding protein